MSCMDEYISHHHLLILAGIISKIRQQILAARVVSLAGKIPKPWSYVMLNATMSTEHSASSPWKDPHLYASLLYTRAQYRISGKTMI